MRKDFLTFGSPQILQEDIDEVVDTLKSGWLGTGPKVAVFESMFATYKNSKYAVAVSSCTAAIHLSLLALDLKPGDEVITSSMTFCATINAIIHSGATPVIVDVDNATKNLDPDRVKEAITSRSKAIIPVHYAGYPCDMDALMIIAKDNNLYIVEDCAHAIETQYNGKSAGTFGDFGCFSFYVTKNLVTAEGGMILIKDKSMVSKIRSLCLHGMSDNAWKRYSNTGYKSYSVVAAGFKYNMTDIQASLGIQQLKRIEENWIRRQEIWDIYMSELSDLKLILPPIVPDNIKHAYHLFHIAVHNKLSGISRDMFIRKIQEQNIGVGIHYTAIASYSYYQEQYGWDEKDYSNAVEHGKHTVSIPMSPALSDSDVRNVINAIRSIVYEK